MSSQRPRGKPLRSGKAVKDSPPKPAAEDFVSQVQYEKTSTSAFQLKWRDISQREAADYNSHDINWIVPGFTLADSVQTEVATEIRDTLLSIENVSPYTLYFRIQKPMGYRADPSALAMWEPIYLGSKQKTLLLEIKPHTTRNFTFRNHSTNMVVPRQTVVNGKVCIHLYSIIPMVEPFTDNGVPAKFAERNAISAIITTTVNYVSNNGDVGSEDSVIIESFRGSRRLDQVTNGPAVPIRLCDLHVPGHSVIAGALYATNTNRRFSNSPPNGKVTTTNYGAVLAFDAGTTKLKSDEPELDYEVDNLDKSTTYMLPFSVTGKVGDKKVVSNLIRFNNPARLPNTDEYPFPPDMWLVGAYSALTADYGKWSFLIVDKTVFSTALPGQTRLQPLSGITVRGYSGIRCALDAEEPTLPLASNVLVVKSKLRPTKPIPRLAALQVPHDYADLRAADDSVATTILQALTIIVKAVTISVELASAFGFLSIPLDNLKGQALDIYYDGE